MNQEPVILSNAFTCLLEVECVPEITRETGMLIPTQRCRFLHLHGTKHSPVNMHWVSESWRDATGDPRLENQSSLVRGKLHGSIKSRYMWLTAVGSSWTLYYSPGDQPPWGSLVAGLEYAQAKNSWENWANAEKKKKAKDKVPRGLCSNKVQHHDLLPTADSHLLCPSFPRWIAPSGSFVRLSAWKCSFIVTLHVSKRCIQDSLPVGAIEDKEKSSYFLFIVVVCFPSQTLPFYIFAS